MLWDAAGHGEKHMPRWGAGIGKQESGTEESG